MADPTAPVLPNDAPQDVKDFFDCKGDKLVWKKGKVTWLGLGVDPDVSFEHGKVRDTIDITINFPVLPKFTINASVNDAGELVVDTSKIPDLSTFKEGAGKKGVDDAIKNINDWFKKNGKKLKKAVYKKGEVTLEKTAITMAYVPPVEGPATAPVTYATTALAAYEPQQRSMAPMLLMLMIGVVILGLLIGFLAFGGNGPGGVANASPTSAPTASPTATPSATPSDEPTPTPTSSLQAYISSVCARVKHENFGAFVSYIDWLMYWDGFDVDHFVLTVAGANNGAPLDLVFDPETGGWTGKLGLMSAGEKQIGQLVAVLNDGTPIDITDDLVGLLGEFLDVRYPQEDTFGICPD